MRDILISLKPYYYYLIGENIKKVEVRKSYPKAEDWSKSGWFYMSRDEKSFAKIPKEFQEKYRKHFGKVGMRFGCDRIDRVASINTPCMDYIEVNDKWHKYFSELSCLTVDELGKYLVYNKYGYGWHITDLVVYDEPRELRDFKPYNRTEEDCKFSHLGLAIPKCNDCRVCYVKRPLQSWGYVEATEPRQTADWR